MLSETVRLFRAGVRPGPSHSLLSGGGSAVCTEGHKDCWKSHCSFRVFCSTSESTPPPHQILKAGLLGAKTTCATCGNTPACNRQPVSKTHESNFPVFLDPVKAAPLYLPLTVMSVWGLFSISFWFPLRQTIWRMTTFHVCECVCMHTCV